MLSSSADSRSSAATTGLEVRPFRALTYRRRDPGHLARVTSPAYDLVTPAGRDRLAEADPYNIVRLILPRVGPAPDAPGAQSAPRDAGAGVAADGTALRSAEEAAALLRSWIEQGVLERDGEAALWLYELRPPGGIPATTGWLGAVGLPAAGSAAVLPHEDTYPVAVEGRRALLAATATDLEPIVLAHDPDPEVAELTAAARTARPTLTVEDTDGVRHRLWRMTDADLVRRVTHALRRTGAVIADGHHRFAAARAHFRSEPGGPGSDAVLALVTPMGAGGLRVDPIHRVVPDLEFDDALDAAARGFAVAELGLPEAGPAAVIAEARRWLADPDETGFLLTDGRRLVQLTAPSVEVLASVPSEAPAAWRRLDVVLAHHGLLGALWHHTDDADSVVIAHDVAAATQTAVERGGVGVLLRAPSPSDVAAVARAGARMPRKSTLFVPKPRTGLVMRPLDG